MLFDERNPNEVYIIAEIGVNHNGSIEIASQLVRKASESGVNAVKFQNFKADKLLSSKNIDKAPYQNRDNSDNQYTMLKKLELSYDATEELKRLCDDLNIDFLSTPYDADSISLLKNIGLTTIKIASADIVNKSLIDCAIEQNMNIILSEGMADYREISRTLDYIQNKSSNIKIALLHCTTSYPTDSVDVNMNVMLKLIKDYGKQIMIGYSDHTIGNDAAIMAVSLGARIIEKHFTLDRNMIGPDHFASSEPDDLEALARSIRNVEKAFGSENKYLTSAEKENIKVMRCSCHASTDLKQGQTILSEHITFTRPNDGYPVWNYEDLIGRKLISDLNKGDPINISSIEFI